MRILSSMFLACALLTTLACSTNSVSNRNANQNTSFANPAFQTTARTIKNQRPEISDERLIQDGRMINEQSPAIVAYYEQRGFNKEQAQKALLATWQDLRLHQATASLNEQDFTASAKDWGILVIKSSPAEANVMVGDKKLDEPTETEALLRPGNYQVELSKLGYRTVTGTCQIAAGKKTEFIRTLPPVTP